MALALRIDGITPLDQGGVSLAYTLGQTPLPAEAAGTCIETSAALMNAQLADVQPFQFMLLLAFALWKANNPALNNPSLFIGKTLTVTPGSASPVSIS